jgi:MazG family protein
MTPPDRFERAGAAFARLCRTMARLRAECPWDREQTYQSLRQYLIEETYETLEAIDGGDPVHHCEELGDLLFQVVFQAEIAHGAGEFDAAGVVDGINQKLVRRHPHVFGDARGERGPAAARRWADLKAEEKPDRSPLAGIPRAMPALLRALRTGEKAAAVGFDWPEVSGVLDKVREELAELEAVIGDAGSDAERHEELGDLLYAVVSLGRHLGLDPEHALGGAVDKFHRRFRTVEDTLKQRGEPIAETPLETLEELWQQAKARQS